MIKMEDSKGDLMMKKRNGLFMAGLMVATVMVAGISVNAAGTLVEESTDTVVERFGGHRGGDRQKGGNDYSAAIEEGILSQTEADAIITYRGGNQGNREALRAEVEGLTREEARAYMQENGTRSEDPLADLVEEGLLTEEQASELEAFRPDMDNEDRVNRGSMKGNRGNYGYEKAIEEGILTEDDVAAIEAFREANQPDKATLEAELDGLTREEARAYMEDNYPKHDLVEEGLLTQEQVDSLEALRESFEGQRPDRSTMDGERSNRRGMKSVTTEDEIL